MLYLLQPPPTADGIGSEHDDCTIIGALSDKVLRLQSLLRRVLDWRALDGDGITDPLRQEIADALDRKG